MKDRTALARVYVELHNAAAKEYKAAFKAIGARMWHDDKAHPLKPQHEEFIAEQMGRRTVEEIRSIYRIVHPLTVLDSYPDVSVEDRKRLRAQVMKIHDQWQAEWELKLLEEHEM